MIQIADGFEYKGNKPLDSRLKYATITEMVAVPVANLYDGCEAYVTATKKYYSYDSTNEVDETLGKWRERQSGGSGTSDYSDLSNKPSIENVTLSGNKSASDLGLAKLTDLADFITKTVDDLVNYYTKSQSYSKTEVDAIVTAIKNSRFEVVATLPTTNIKTNVIYLVPSSDPQTSNAKDEYINLDGTTSGWEKIGSTSVDLSGYVTETELNTALADYTTTTDLTTLLNSKQDVFRKNSMPTATEELVGTMYQYMGATNATYTHGYWYECVVGTEPSTYMWQQTNQQPSSGGGGSYTAGDGIDITNDVISTKQSEEGDIDEIIDVYPTAGNLVSIVNAFNRGDIYSTDEKMIGQWYDGKPLYQKTIDCGALPNATVKEIEHNISNIDKIISIQGVATSSAETYDLPMVYRNSDATYNTAVSANNTYVILRNSQDRSMFSGYVTIQYTKTTDTAISIGEATEYSTEEKVVGTWVDGKPVWQKTWNNLNLELSNNTWTTTTIPTNGISKLIDAIVHSSNGTVISSINCAMDGNYININNTSYTKLYADSLTLQYIKTTT